MSRLGVVVIVGRPNVGKSTLFNALTRTRDALVADMPGVTRDRIYGQATLKGHPVILVDTGGLEEATEALAQAAQAQTQEAIDEADVLVFVSDARSGVTGADFDIVQRLRRTNKPIIHAVNKVDGMDLEAVLAESTELGLSQLCAIAASHRRGLDHLASEIAGYLPDVAPEPVSSDSRIRLALLGRPNAGKSTLLNRFVGEERALASPVPGTTRDPVSAEVRREGQDYVMVDTAGIRRRRGSHEGIEKLSTLKALQAMHQAHIVILVIDALEGVSEQDARLAGHVLEAQRALILAINKWDQLDERLREQCLVDMRSRLEFALFAPVVVISALHGSGLGELTDAIEHVYRAAKQELSTPALTRLLRDSVQAHPPGGGDRFRPKLRFAHMGGLFPTRIIIHGSRTDSIKDQYKRYLINQFRRHFKLTGIPIQLIFKESANPYAGRKNKLTPRQIQKRKRKGQLGRVRKKRS
jgi:GTP-binding protein